MKQTQKLRIKSLLSFLRQLFLQITCYREPVWFLRMLPASTKVVNKELNKKNSYKIRNKTSQLKSTVLTRQAFMFSEVKSLECSWRWCPPNTRSLNLLIDPILKNL